MTDVDVDRSMLIWKAVMESRRRALEDSREPRAPARAMPAEDHDARYHPAEAQLALADPGAAPQPDPQQPQGGRYHQAEPDMDEVYHHFPDPARAAKQQEKGGEEEGDPLEQAQLKGPGTWARVYEQAEVDLDGLYHGDMGQVQVETHVEPDKGDMSVPGQRGCSLPPEDLDDLYHKY